MNWNLITDTQDYELKHQKEYEINSDYNLQTDNRLLYIAVRTFVERQRQPYLDESNSRIKIKKTQTKLIVQFINKIKFERIPVEDQYEFDYFKRYFQNEHFEAVVKFQPSNKLFMVFEDKNDRLRQKIKTFELKQIIVGQHFQQKHQIILDEVSKLADITLSYEKENNILIVYGRAFNVNKYAKMYNEAYEKINISKYELKDKKLNERLFAYKRGLAELRYKTKVVIQNDKVCIIHKKKANPIQETLSEISFDKLKILLKKPQLKNFISQNRDLVILKDIKIIGPRFLIDMLDKLAEQQLAYSKNKKVLQRKNQLIVFTCHRLQINQSSYPIILNQFKSVKFCGENNYSLQIHNMRISNFVNSSSFYILVFVQFSELIQLQTFVQIEDGLGLINNVIDKFKQDFIHKVQKFKMEQDNCSIIFYKKQQLEDWNTIVDIINQSNTISRTIILKKKWFQQLYAYKSKLNSFVNVVVDEYLWQGPDFTIDIIQHIENYKVNIQRNPSKLVNFVQHLLNMNIRNYSYESYKLDAITCFNIQKMKIEKIRQIDIIICPNKMNNPKQFVYLTFYQKLFQIEYVSNKVELKEVKNIIQYFQKKQISRMVKKMIMSGFSFCYLVMRQFRRLQTVDNSLFFATEFITDELRLLYYRQKLQDNHLYKFQISNTPQTMALLKKLIHTEKVNLEDKHLYDELAKISIAYGRFEKRRQNEGIISFTGDHDVVVDVIDQLLSVYHNRKKQSIR